jgi:hypothetical protein
MSKTSDVLNKIAEQIGDDYITGTVFDPTTGLGVVTRAGDPDFDTETMNAYISEYLKEVGKTFTNLKMPSRVVEYLVTANEEFTILIRGITGTKYFQSCVVKKGGNLGLTKEILRKNETSLIQELKKL